MRPDWPLRIVSQQSAKRLNYRRYANPDGFDVSVDRAQVHAHRHNRYVAPTGVAPRGNVARPLVVPSAVLLDEFEPK
jgi:hypothetical protein